MRVMKKTVKKTLESWKEKTLLMAVAAVGAVHCHRGKEVLIVEVEVLAHCSWSKKALIVVVEAPVPCLKNKKILMVVVEVHLPIFQKLLHLFSPWETILLCFLSRMTRAVLNTNEVHLPLHPHANEGGRVGPLHFQRELLHHLLLGFELHSQRSTYAVRHPATLVVKVFPFQLAP